MENLPGLDKAISMVVRAIRAKTGLSQEQFADFAGLSRVYIAQLETGERGASLNALILIAQSVGMTGAELVGIIEKEMKKKIDHIRVVQRDSPLLLFATSGVNRSISCSV